MQEIEGTVLGFDFGLRRIGVAVGQTITKTASPLKTLLANNGDPNWQELMELLGKWQPIALVVGVPVNLDGSEQRITVAAKNFIEQLHQKCDITVFHAEERLTTKCAREDVFARGGYKALKKTAIDGIAACLILEEWLQSH